MDTGKRKKAQCLAVDVMRRCELWGDTPSDGELVSAAQAAFLAVSRAVLEAESCEISLVLTSDEEICTLNKSWRGKDEPTNVLSFPLGEMPYGDDGKHLDPLPLGDVILAFETVTREAKIRGIELGQHSAHLVVHGVLHLLGYDHVIDGEAEKMEKLETQILKTLGQPDPYSFEMMRNGETK